MLLGGRLWNRLDEEVIQEVIQKHFKRTINPSVLFGHDGGDGSLTSRPTLQLLRQSPPHGFNHLVWIPELLKMAILLHRALQFDEPVLLVGNTGYVTNLFDVTIFVLDYAATLKVIKNIVSAPDPKLTPAQIAFRITHVILEATCIPCRWGNKNMKSIVLLTLELVHILMVLSFACDRCGKTTLCH